MECLYCSGSKSVLNTRTKLSLKGDFYPGIDVFIDDPILCIESYSDTYEPGFLEADVKINYCPMCGKKLTTDESEKS